MHLYTARFMDARNRMDVLATSQIAAEDSESAAHRVGPPHMFQVAVTDRTVLPIGGRDVGIPVIVQIFHNSSPCGVFFKPRVLP